MKNVVALAIGVLISFLMAEIVVRMLPRQWVPELDPIQPETILLGGMAKGSSNPRLYYELMPGTYQINAAGYRGPEYPESKPARVKASV
jgi:hypothetical protein